MKRFVNLLPDDHKRRTVTRRLLRFWTGLVAASAIVLVSYLFFEIETKKYHINRRLAAEAKARPYIEMSSSIQRMTDEIKSIEQNDAILRRLMNEGSPILPVAVISKGAKATGGRVSVLRLDFTTDIAKQDQVNEKNGVSKGSSAASEEIHQKLVVDGVAQDNLAVADFVAHLRSTGAFRNLELRSALSAPTDAGQFTFSLEGEF